AEIFREIQHLDDETAIAALGIAAWFAHEPWTGPAGIRLYLAVTIFFVVTSSWFSWRIRSTVAFVIFWLVGTFALNRTIVMAMGSSGNSLAVAAALTSSGILAPLASVILDAPGATNRFARPLQGLSLALLSLAALLLSFRDFSREAAMQTGAYPWILSLSILFSLSATGAIFLRERKNSGLHPAISFTQTPLLSLAGAGALLMLLQFHEALVVIAGNLAAAYLGCFALKTGLDSGSRGRFWFGLFLIVLVIAARFFEYDTGLQLKSAVFILLGIFVMAGGYAFERRRADALRMEHGEGTPR
ncbi:MAG: hypothetical protein AAB229_05820, partial [Candidatus Hydrogenedentota bacterium]